MTPCQLNFLPSFHQLSPWWKETMRGCLLRVTKGSPWMVRKGRIMARIKKGSQQMTNALIIIPSTVEALCSFRPPNSFSKKQKNREIYLLISIPRRKFKAISNSNLHPTIQYWIGQGNREFPESKRNGKKYKFGESFSIYFFSSFFPCNFLLLGDWFKLTRKN